MTDLDTAAAARAAYVTALREELRGYRNHGRDDRIAAVEAELEQVEGKPEGRSDAPAAAAPPRRKRAK